MNQDGRDGGGVAMVDREVVAMTTLLERLISATGPSRELNAEIALASGWKAAATSFAAYWAAPNGEIFPDPPRYTESIDAVRRDLLGKRPAVLKFNTASGKCEARVGALPGEDYMIKGGEHEVAAIALLIAIRKAVEEK